MSRRDSKGAEDDMFNAMEKTMQQLQDRFQTVSEQIENKMVEMGTRIDDLEKNIAELMKQAGTEE